MQEICISNYYCITVNNIIVDCSVAMCLEANQVFWSMRNFTANN